MLLDKGMEYKLSAVVSREDKFFVARGIEVEIASQGRTFEEALSNLREVFQLWLKHATAEELEVFVKDNSPIMTQVAVAA